MNHYQFIITYEGWNCKGEFSNILQIKFIDQFHVKNNPLNYGIIYILK